MGSRLAPPRIEIHELQARDYTSTAVSRYSPTFFVATCIFQTCSLRALLINSESSVHYMPVIAAGIVVAAGPRFANLDPSRLRPVGMTFLPLSVKVFATTAGIIETDTNLVDYIRAPTQKRITINYHVCSYIRKQPRDRRAVVGTFNNRRFHPCTYSTSIIRESCEEMHARIPHADINVDFSDSFSRGSA